MNTTPSVKAGAGRLTALRSISVIFGLMILAALPLLNACGEDETLPTFPVEPLPEAQNWLFGVYGTAANNVYACGSKGSMFRFDGTSWSPVDMGTSRPIVDIWGTPDGGTLYAVGHGGRIWRNTGTSWSSMDSGTTRNLYGVGSFDGVVHAVGDAGTIRRLSGSTWSGVGGSMFILDENGAAQDTLQMDDDVASLVAVNHFFIGGAFFDPNFEFEPVGTVGTKGMVLAANTDPLLDGPWILRPISGEQRVADEWVLSMTSDPANLARNLMGTTEGWLFRLAVNDDGLNVWEKFYPSFTSDPGAGISDIWLDANENVYLVTNEGQVVFQSFDYDFVQGTGDRRVLYDGVLRLTGIWGTGPDNLVIVGFQEGIVIHANHDQATDAFIVTEMPVDFAAKASAPMRDRDHLDRPLLP